MERKDLYYVLFEQQKDFKPINKLVLRDKVRKVKELIPLGMPIVITGVRRCGKSSLLKLLKDNLKLKEKQYLYINFNDERLVNFSTEDFQKILDFLEEQDYMGKCYLFIDEVQEVQGWEKWVDRIRDKHNILISGSNSKLLSREISTVLTGRSLNISLFPFSFKEFLTTRSLDLKNWEIDLKLQSRIRKEFALFLESGGFPQRIVSGKDVIVSELYGNILYRDIIGRFNKNLIKPIKEISLYLISNITSDISLRKLSAMSGVKNIASVREILDSFENAFLFFSISKFDYSVKKQTQNPRKIYCIDNGFPFSLGFRFSQDKGKLLENFVAIELKRRDKETYYHKERFECDFITKDKLNISEAIQVCHDFNENNKEREIKGLLEALNKFKLKKGKILTYNQEEVFNIKGKKVIIQPVWKWLLEKK